MLKPLRIRYIHQSGLSYDKYSPYDICETAMKSLMRMAGPNSDQVASSKAGILYRILSPHTAQKPEKPPHLFEGLATLPEDEQPAVVSI